MRLPSISEGPFHHLFFLMCWESDCCSIPKMKPPHSSVRRQGIISLKPLFFPSSSTPYFSAPVKNVMEEEARTTRIERREREKREGEGGIQIQLAHTPPPHLLPLFYYTTQLRSLVACEGVVCVCVCECEKAAKNEPYFSPTNQQPNKAPCNGNWRRATQFFWRERARSVVFFQQEK